jgi:hypothetical protein
LTIFFSPIIDGFRAKPNIQELRYDQITTSGPVGLPLGEHGALTLPYE